MTAATDRIPLEPVDGNMGPRCSRGLLDAGDVLKRGWLVLIDSDGYIREATETTGMKSAGWCAADVSNSGGADGAKVADIVEGVGRVRMGSSGDAITRADMGKVLYAVDNQTVSTVSTGRSPAGIMWDMDDESSSHVLMLAGKAARAIIDGKLQGVGIQLGSGVLSSGVLTVTAGITVTAASRVFPVRLAPAGTMGVELKADPADFTVGTPDTGEIVIKSLKTDKTTETSDTSTVAYIIVN